MARKQRRGMVLSLTIVVLVILLVLSTAVTSMGTANLNQALSLLNGERGYQVAEAGLGYAYSDLSMGRLSLVPGPGFLPNKTYTLSQSLSQDQAFVEIYDNSSGATPNPPGCPTTIPNGYMYLVSTGRLMSNGNVATSRKVGAMVCLGGGGGMSYGINCRELTVDQGILTAWDLNTNAEVSGYIVAASNTTSLATGPVKLADSPGKTLDCRGNLLLSAGVSAAVVEGNYTFSTGGHIQNFASALSFPRITVPTLPTKPAGNTPASLQPLPSGHYAALNVVNTAQLSGRYVVDNLVMKPGGHLAVPQGNTVQLFVHNFDLTQADAGPLFTHRGSSNHFKVAYDGNSPRTLSLDTNAHLSLVAPHADVTVNASDLTIGSLAAKNLVLNMASPTARFCYDPTAAQPPVAQSSQAQPPQPPIVPPSMNGPQTQSGGSTNAASTANTNSPDSIIPGYRAVTVVGRQRF